MRRSPRLALALLQRLARVDEAVVGDLLEQFNHRGSFWFSCQVGAAVVVSASRWRLAPVAAAAVATGIIVAGTLGVSAQSSDRFQLLNRQPTSAEGRDLVTAIDVLPPRAATPWHSHPGEMVGHVSQGTVVIEQEGEASLTVNDGGSFVIEAGRVHRSTNPSRRTARMFVAFFVAEDKAFSRPERR